MSGVAFDTDARAEFLAAVEYYEECQQARKVAEVQSRKTPILILFFNELNEWTEFELA